MCKNDLIDKGQEPNNQRTFTEAAALCHLISKQLPPPEGNNDFAGVGQELLK